MRSTVLFALLVLLPSLGHTQTPAPQFDVASIKQNTSGDSRAFSTPPGLLGEGQISMVNLPLRDIIAQAFGVRFDLRKYLLAGRPDDVLSTRFDIRAKAAARVSPDEALLMLRSLLAERFKLRIHTENRPTPVYALLVLRAGKLGPDIRSTAYDCAAWQKARQTNPDADQPRDINGDRVCARSYEFGPTMKMRWAGPASDLASRLQGWVDRPVVDSTGLTGSFDWVFAFARDSAAASDAPTIFQAVQDRLGLKLESRTESREVFVIDHVERPTLD